MFYKIPYVCVAKEWMKNLNKLVMTFEINSVVYKQSKHPRNKEKRPNFANQV